MNAARTSGFAQTSARLGARASRAITTLSLKAMLSAARFAGLSAEPFSAASISRCLQKLRRAVRFFDGIESGRLRRCPALGNAYRLMKLIRQVAICSRQLPRDDQDIEYSNGNDEELNCALVIAVALTQPDAGEIGCVWRQ